VGRRGARAREARGQTDLPLRRLLRVPLVPRDGARVLRGPAHRGFPRRALRLDQGRPRGAPGRRRDLHEGRAGAHGPRRMADERVADAGTRAVLRRDLLPARSPPRTAELHGRPDRDRERVGEGPREPAPAGRTTRRRDPARGRRGCARRSGSGLARSFARGARAELRSRMGRLRRRAEVPARDGHRDLPRAPRAHEGREGAPHRDAHAGPHGGRRDPRPARRRFPPLQRRRALVDPPLREDALRQRAARAGVRGCVARRGRAALRRSRALDVPLDAARDVDARRRPRQQSGRGQRGRGRTLLRVDTHAARRGARSRDGRARGGVLGRHRTRQLRTRHQRVVAAAPSRRGGGRAARRARRARA
jgi:hypothetical protein